MNNGGICSVTIVYLSWLPYGIEQLKEFIDSYKRFPAGHPHEMLVVFNGLSLENGIDSFLDLLKKELPGARCLTMEKGQDIDAYFLAASRITTEAIFFLNTYSRFTRADWLRLFVSCKQSGNYSLVGATASNQSHYDTVFINNSWRWQKGSTLSVQFRKYKLLLKNLFYWRFLFPPFPNPHIRTNAWMIETAVLRLVKKKKLRSKFDAYRFESGRESLTRQVAGAGRNIAVAGADGVAYDIAAWKQSKTFWISEQENCLITDNQTDLYQAADASYRKYLRTIAWHEQV